MEVILLERIEKLGQMGEVVRVKDGFARNYLLPRQKALRANATNMERFEREREGLERRNAEEKTRAEKNATGVDGQSFILIRQAGDTGQLYGSVSTRDIATAVTSAGTEVKRGQIVLDKAIKQLGVYEIKVQLHPDVVVQVHVNVARTEEEAERQARGEDVTAEENEGELIEEEAIAPEEVFEDEEQARQAEEELVEATEEASIDAAIDAALEGDSPARKEDAGTETESEEEHTSKKSG